MATGGIRAPRRLVTSTAAWLLTLLVATIAGVMPLQSLLGTPSQSTGLLFFASSGLLLLAGSCMTDDLVARAIDWCIATGAIIALIALTGSFVPLTVGEANIDRGFTTLGQPVFTASYLAVAALGAVERSRGKLLALAPLFLICSGLAITRSRTALIALPAGLILILIRGRFPRRRVGAVLLVIGSAFALWWTVDAVVPSALSPAEKLTAARVGASTRARLAAWEIGLDASRVRPITGWGPNATWTANLATATEDQIRAAGGLRAGGRGWGDAHNIFVETAIAGGFPALATFTILFIAVVIGGIRGPTAYSWPAAGALSLFLFHLTQPLNIVTTPMMFFFAGLATMKAGGAKVRLRGSLVLVIVIVGLSLAVARTSANAIYVYGHRYGSPTALRVATWLDPTNIRFPMALARWQAISARSGNASAGEEAHDLARSTYRSLSWHPGAGPSAAHVYYLLDDAHAVEEVLRQHLERFPNDPVAYAGLARLALEEGDERKARRLASMVLRLSPEDRLAREILGDPDDARSGSPRVGAGN